MARCAEQSCTISAIERAKGLEFARGGASSINNTAKHSVDIQQFEIVLRKSGYRRIAGVDEAGRGALAGPVVASAVILPIDCRISRLTDSKQLTPRQREQLFDEIHSAATAIGVGCIDSEEIDRINILQATMQAMGQAIARICPPPDYVLVDGAHIPQISLPARAFPKGDALIPSIAAASIIAKVTRDRLMVEMDKRYPSYDFQRHKGYGTPQHRQAIARFGHCPIHRRSFKLQ